MGVDYGGRIAFFVDDSRRVYVEKADEEVRDPIIERFLDFLAHDMAQHPGTAIVPLPAELRERMAALVGDIDVDLDADIDGDVVI